MVEQQTPKPRGRAASEIRTGLFIREYLLKNGEGAIIDLHNSFKQKIIRHNLLRPRAKRLGKPTYESFYKYFSHLRRLQLVEYVRDEPIEQLGHDTLLSIRDGQVVQSTRRIYRLTAFGASPQSDFLWPDPLLRKQFQEAQNP